jgi:ABC-2 type transport system permease protein
MSSKGITPGTHPTRTGPWEQSGEGAPSVVRTDDPGLARTIGSIGAALVIFGGVALVFNRAGRATPIGTGWASFFLAVGLGGLLFHAAFDWDTQFRRLYMAFGYLGVAAGALLCALPYPKVGDQFGPGFLCLLLGLLFLLAFLRNETDEWLRQLAQYVLGSAGATMAATGLVGGMVSVNFLVPIGLLLALLGLVYQIAYITSRGTNDDRAYMVGIGLGLEGALVFLIALGRIAFSGRPIEYFVPAGALLLFLGVVYAIASAVLCSDHPLAVLTRRELGAFFYSPMAYIVLVVCVLADWVAYFLFVSNLLQEDRPQFEPIIRGFILQWPTVIFTLCIVPVLTMRLLSEERRSGTLEVLLTVPVSEVSVTLSKFIAAFIMFLLTWVPFALYIVFLRLETGKAFDYRPLLSFFVGLCITGAGFVSMGVFFSSLTRNQIGSGVLTLVGMLALTLLFLANFVAKGKLGPDNAWSAVLTHVSYIDIWINTLDGKLQPRYLLFFGTATVLWLFMTVKVLEARKWAA